MRKLIDRLDCLALTLCIRGQTACQSRVSSQPFSDVLDPASRTHALCARSGPDCATWGNVGASNRSCSDFLGETDGFKLSWESKLKDCVLREQTGKHAPKNIQVDAKLFKVEEAFKKWDITGDGGPQALHFQLQKVTSTCLS